MIREEEFIENMQKAVKEAIDKLWKECARCECNCDQCCGKIPDLPIPTLEKQSES
jgi:hypothetical protein